MEKADKQLNEVDRKEELPHTFIQPKFEMEISIDEVAYSQLFRLIKNSKLS